MKERSLKWRKRSISWHYRSRTLMIHLSLSKTHTTFIWKSSTGWMRKLLPWMQTTLSHSSSQVCSQLMPQGWLSKPSLAWCSIWTSTKETLRQSALSLMMRSWNSTPKSTSSTQGLMRSFQNSRTGPQTSLVAIQVRVTPMPTEQSYKLTKREPSRV